MEVDKYIRYLRPAGVCLLCAGLCGRSNGLVCPGCLGDLTERLSHCKTCTRTVHKSEACSQCQKEKPWIDELRFACSYNELSAKLIQLYKFESCPELAKSMADLFCKDFESGKDSMPDCIVPVPLHGNRLRERGYDQAALLAFEIGKRLDVLVDTKWVKRIKATRQQSDLGNKARVGNVRGAFVATGSRSYQRVALVDDVITTGATINAVARTLAGAGRDIQAWSFAGASI